MRRSKQDIHLQLIEGVIQVPTRLFSKGFYKGVAHWIKCLFTEPGTDLSDPNYGAGLSVLGWGNALGEEHAMQLATMAVDQATTTIKVYQSARDIPDHEKIASAEVRRVYFPEKDHLALEVALFNEAGEHMILRLPLDIT